MIFDVLRESDLIEKTPTSPFNVAIAHPQKVSYSSNYYRCSLGSYSPSRLCKCTESILNFISRVQLKINYEIFIAKDSENKIWVICKSLSSPHAIFYNENGFVNIESWHGALFWIHEIATKSCFSGIDKISYKGNYSLQLIKIINAKYPYLAQSIISIALFEDILLETSEELHDKEEEKKEFTLDNFSSLQLFSLHRDILSHNFVNDSWTNSLIEMEITTQNLYHMIKPVPWKKLIRAFITICDGGDVYLEKKIEENRQINNYFEANLMDVYILVILNNLKVEYLEKILVDSRVLTICCKEHMLPTLYAILKKIISKKHYKLTMLSIGIITKNIKSVSISAKKGLDNIIKSLPDDIYFQNISHEIASHIAYHGFFVYNVNIPIVDILL